MRSESLGDFYDDLVMLTNIKNKFGKGLWGNSANDTDKGLVDPLKIIRLPSGRSAPKTVV